MPQTEWRWFVGVAVSHIEKAMATYMEFAIRETNE